MAKNKPYIKGHYSQPVIMVLFALLLLFFYTAAISMVYFSVTSFGEGRHDIISYILSNLFVIGLLVTLILTLSKIFYSTRVYADKVVKIYPLLFGYRRSYPLSTFDGKACVYMRTYRRYVGEVYYPYVWLIKDCKVRCSIKMQQYSNSLELYNAIQQNEPELTENTFGEMKIYTFNWGLRKVPFATLSVSPDE